MSSPEAVALSIALGNLPRQPGRRLECTHHPWLGLADVLHLDPNYPPFQNAYWQHFFFRRVSGALTRTARAPAALTRNVFYNYFGVR